MIRSLRCATTRGRLMAIRFAGMTRQFSGAYVNVTDSFRAEQSLSEQDGRNVEESTGNMMTNRDNGPSEINGEIDDTHIDLIPEVRLKPDTVHKITDWSALESEKLNPMIKASLTEFYTKYGGSLNFDNLYMPIIIREKVTVDPVTKEVSIHEKVLDLKMSDFFKKEIGIETERVVAFLCFRKNHVTQIEMDYCLRALLKKSNIIEFLEGHPDIIELITKQLETIDIVTFDSGVAFFELVSDFYLGAVPAGVVNNFLKQLGHEMTRFLFDTSEMSYVPRLEELLELGYKPNEEKTKEVLAFAHNFFDLFAAQSGKKLRKNTELTNMYDLDRFFNKLYCLTPVLTITQALSIFRAFYEKVVKTLPVDESVLGVTVDHEQIEGMSMHTKDVLANLALLDFLDLYFCEHVSNLTLKELSFCMFVFAKCGRRDCALAIKCEERLEMTERNWKRSVSEEGTIEKDKEIEVIESKVKKVNLDESAAEFDIIFQLIWSLSQFTALPDMAGTWNHLETMLLRSFAQLSSELNPIQVGMIISSFYKVNQGSTELWISFLDYIKYNPSKVSFSLKSLVMHTLLLKGEFKSQTDNCNYMINILITQMSAHWNLIDQLASSDVPNVNSRLKLLLHLAMLPILHAYDRLRMPLTELSTRVRQLLLKQNTRKLIGEEPIVLAGLTTIVQRDLIQEMTIMLRPRSSSREVKLKVEQLHGWNNYSKVLYYLERKLGDFRLTCPLLMYIYLGRLHLTLQPLISQMPHEDEFYDNLIIKRRVLHHEVNQSLKSQSPGVALQLIHMMVIEGYTFDSTMRDMLAFRVSQTIEAYTVIDLVTVMVAIRQMAMPADDAFFELFQAVIQAKCDVSDDVYVDDEVEGNVEIEGERTSGDRVKMESKSDEKGEFVDSLSGSEMSLVQIIKKWLPFIEAPSTLKPDSSHEMSLLSPWDLDKILEKRKADQDIYVMDYYHKFLERS